MRELVKTDRRILRTKSSLYEALFSLLKTKSVADITVKELAENANINRKTFYIHYQTVTEVLDEWFWEFGQMIAVRIERIYEEYGAFTAESFKVFLNFLMEEDKAVLELMKSPNVTLTMDKIQSVLHKLFREELEQRAGLIIKEKINEKLLKTENDFEVLASYIAGGVMSVYYHCIIRNCDKLSVDIDEIARMLSLLTLNGISEFLK